ncbi:MAG: protease modulator HflC [Rickettsiales bacterium]|nr:protease modulator HflC [Rickettsiales bacterium]
MTRVFGGAIIVAFLALFILANALFVVGQTEQAIILQFGKPERVENTPGLKVKVPFMQNVEFFDKRLLDFDAETKEVIAADQKRLRVDAFLRYRIADPLRFKQSVGDERTMKNRLNSILESSLRQALGNVPLSAVISEKRSPLMQQIRDLVNQQTLGVKAVDADKKITSGGFGVEVVDVRIKRADLPPANSEGIYKRMQTERHKEANQYRAQGAEDAQETRSKADKERTILLAEAKRKSEVLRGEGDSSATKIFGQSFGQDQEFFQFYRTLQAYRKTLSDKDTTMVMSPDNDFLKYLEKGGNLSPAR